MAFSCKGRGACPSCNAKRLVASAAHLVDHVFPHVPLRQWVLSVPKTPEAVPSSPAADGLCCPAHPPPGPPGDLEEVLSHRTTRRLVRGRQLSPSVRQEGTALFLELEGVLWFGSAPTLEKALLASLERATGIERVVLDLQGLGRVDVTGALVPGQLRENAEGAGLEVEFLNLPPHSEQVLGEVLGGRAS